MGRKIPQLEPTTTVPDTGEFVVHDATISDLKKRDRRIAKAAMLSDFGIDDLAYRMDLSEADIISLLADMIVAQQDIIELQGEIGSFPGKLEMYTGADLKPGYIWARGETIGNTGSGATYAGPQYEDLFDMYNAAGLWGNPGGAVFAAGGTVLAPDVRNITVYGGNAATREISGVTHPATPLGTTHNDRLQTHGQELKAGNGSNDNLSASNYLRGTAQGGFYVGSDSTNVTNTKTIGNPTNARTGTTTMAAGIGVNYIIKT